MFDTFLLHFLQKKFVEKEMWEFRAVFLMAFLVECFFFIKWISAQEEEEEEEEELH
jgi:hypothetical protein